MSAPLPPTPDPDATSWITARLDAARREAPCLEALEVTDLIRHVTGKRAILRGTLDGRRVILRLHFTPDQDDALREWDEMQRLWPHMSTGDLRIPEPILIAPEAGLIVQEEAAGTPLLELLYSLDPPERAAWLGPAAGWLRASTRISEEWHAPQPDKWIARAARASAQQPFETLRALELQILRQMERIAPLVAAEPWRTAICHGDYHPNNLIVEGTRLTAIDLGGSRCLPVAKDIARFAMHMGRRGLRLSGQSWLGVDRTCLEAFADAFEMGATERGATLPFFLGFEALIRVENKSLPPGRIQRAEKTYRALARDLERVASMHTPL
ncbi:aminoglycoside phosphotransferase family protein [Roseovarius sp. S1116L3]|uniref:aminoglycoside phosphotransferase family protein n=1 Tax=Roseovarius roseus TaxID=3342636 RepID=UPI003727B28B